MSTSRVRQSQPSPPWNPSSWRQKEIHQAPEYSNLEKLNQVERELSLFPGLVAESEVATLKTELAKVARGEAFLLQGGDCAESFSDFSEEQIQGTASLLHRMAEILSERFQKPVVRLGRMAGQFAKPRSSATEQRGGVTLPTYRGDLVNGSGFEADSRKACPTRMHKAYFQSAATLNLLRTLPGTPIYTSHEALLLPYEQGLIRNSSFSQKHFASSAHFVWIGERTRQIEGAHVEFARGISNPIGLKCGPEMKTDDLIRLVQKLNPENESGRLTLIPRLGARSVMSKLPPLIRAIQREGLEVLWCCDPMHGNTYTTESGFKTRSFEDLMLEARSFFEIHAMEGAVPGGLHLEMTSRSVIECTGSSLKIVDRQIQADNYGSLCDPRLNLAQALEFVNQFASSTIIAK